MRSKLAVVCLVSGAILAPFAQAADQAADKKDRRDSDMQRAIAWERFKDQAAERQARKEARHPSVTYRENANREADDSSQGNRVKDPGPPAYRKDKK